MCLNNVFSSPFSSRFYPGLERSLQQQQNFVKREHRKRMLKLQKTLNQLCKLNKRNINLRQLRTHTDHKKEHKVFHSFYLKLV